MKTQSKNKPATAWVIKQLKSGRYLSRLKSSDFTGKLENAEIFPTRTQARTERYTGTDSGYLPETVVKVQLNEKYRAIKVIGGNGPNCRF